MNFIQKNNNWNAEPNNPSPRIRIDKNSLVIEFYLNYHEYSHFKEDQKGKITFHNTYAYRIGPPNDEGFYRNQFRYTSKDFDWGEFYQLLNTKKSNDFEHERKLVNFTLDEEELNHSLFPMNNFCYFI